MKCIVLVCVVVLVVQLCNYAQAAPHKSDEDDDSDESSSTEVTSPAPVVVVVVVPESVMHDSDSHESKSKEDEPTPKEEMTTKEEEEENRSEETGARELDESDEEDDTVKSPKTESLCPARPEEITNIEAECATEYQQWRERRAQKNQLAETTTCDPSQIIVEILDVANETNVSSEDIQIPALEYDMTVDVITEIDTTEMPETEMPDTDMPDTEMPDTDMPDTDMPEKTQEKTMPETTMSPTTMSTTTMSTTTTTMMTTTRPIRRNTKHKRSNKKIVKKRPCYPATCILRKLNLLDSTGQPSISKIKSFAVNMTVDNSNLEEKAVGCVKQINEAIVDGMGDLGKKVGCIAQKVITCLNKGLVCPIMRVPK